MIYAVCLTNTMLKRRLPSRDLDDNIISRATSAKPATCYTSITGETIWYLYPIVKRTMWLKIFDSVFTNGPFTTEKISEFWKKFEIIYDDYESKIDVDFANFDWKNATLDTFRDIRTMVLRTDKPSKLLRISSKISIRKTHPKSIWMDSSRIKYDKFMEFCRLLPETINLFAEISQTIGAGLYIGQTSGKIYTCDNKIYNSIEDFCLNYLTKIYAST